MSSRVVLSILGILVMLGCSSRQRAGTVATPLTLTQADSIWARNYAVHDTAAALRLMSDDFFMTTTNGSVKDRTAELGDIRPQPGMRMDYFRTEDVRTREYGAAGVVTGTASWSYQMNGQTSTTRRRYTAVYSRGGPLGWQLVTLHMGAARP